MLAKNQKVVDQIIAAFNHYFETHDGSKEIAAHLNELAKTYLMYNMLANDREMQVKGGEIWRAQFTNLQNKVLDILKILRDFAGRNDLQIGGLFNELKLDEY